MVADDLSPLDTAQIVAAFVADIRAHGAAEAAAMDGPPLAERARLLEALRDQSDGTLAPLRPLLDADDPAVRLAAAVALRAIDPDAFAKTVSTLAAGNDAIAAAARRAQEDDAQCQRFGYPELRALAHWQCRHPPPPAADREAIAQALTQQLPEATAERLIRLARPAIGLWPQQPPAMMAVGTSRLGGLPDLPPGFAWPEAEGEPLLFLAQFHCTELASLPGADALPGAGLIAVFADEAGVNGDGFSGGEFAVHHFPEIDGLEAATPPENLATVLPCAALAFRPLLDLPDAWSEAARDILADDEEAARYAAVLQALRLSGIRSDAASYCGFGKLLGWPALVQQYDLDPANGPGPDAQRLLLQLDGYANGEDSVGWGPGGSLYFMIAERDLKRRRFPRCEFIMQSM